MQTEKVRRKTIKHDRCISRGQLQLVAIFSTLFMGGGGTHLKRIH